MSTNIFFSLPIELREQIYRYVLDLKVNIIFQSHYKSFGSWDLERDPKPQDDRLYGIEGYIKHLILTTGRPLEYDSNLCSVTYNITPLPRHLLLVSKAFSREVLEADRISRLAIVQDVQRSLDPGPTHEPWRIRLNTQVTPEMQRIMKSARIIFDCSQFEFERQIQSLSPSVRELFRHVMFTAQCLQGICRLGNDSPFPKLETVALLLSKSEGEQADGSKSAINLGLGLLYENQIRRLEVVDMDPNADHCLEISTDMEEWLPSASYSPRTHDCCVVRLSKQSIYNRGRFRSVEFVEKKEEGEGLPRCKEVRIPLEGSVSAAEMTPKQKKSSRPYINMIVRYRRE